MRRPKLWPPPIFNDQVPDVEAALGQSRDIVAELKSATAPKYRGAACTKRPCASARLAAGRIDGAEDKHRGVFQLYYDFDLPRRQAAPASDPRPQSRRVPQRCSP